MGTARSASTGSPEPGQHSLQFSDRCCSGWEGDGEFEVAEGMTTCTFSVEHEVCGGEEGDLGHCSCSV